MNWKRLEQGSIALFLITVFAFSVLMIYSLLLNPNIWFEQAGLLRRTEVLVAGLALIANIGLTGGLIYIYLNQNRVLREEMKILKAQQDLMQAEQQPEIDGPYDLQPFGKNSQQDSSEAKGSVDQFHLSNISWVPDGLKIKGSIETEEDSLSIDVGDSTEEKTIDPPEDGIRFQLTNSGGGPAKRFRLFTGLTVHDGPHEGTMVRSSLKRLDRYSIQEYADNIMQPGEQDISFQGEIQLGIRDPPEEEGRIREFSTLDFSEGVQKLVEEGTREIEVVLELRYEDMFEENYEDQFFRYRAEITPDMDWIEFLHKEPPTIRYVNKSMQKQSKREKIYSQLKRLKNNITSFR